MARREGSDAIDLGDSDANTNKLFSFVDIIL